MRPWWTSVALRPLYWGSKSTLRNTFSVCSGWCVFEIEWSRSRAHLSQSSYWVDCPSSRTLPPTIQPVSYWTCFSWTSWFRSRTSQIWSLRRHFHWESFEKPSVVLLWAKVQSRRLSLPGYLSHNRCSRLPLQCWPRQCRSRIRWKSGSSCYRDPDLIHRTLAVPWTSLTPDTFSRLYLSCLLFALLSCFLCNTLCQRCGVHERRNDLSPSHPLRTHFPLRLSRPILCPLSCHHHLPSLGRNHLLGRRDAVCVRSSLPGGVYRQRPGGHVWQAWSCAHRVQQLLGLWWLAW